MSGTDPIIHGVFGHFQNLNLLALLHDLRSGHTTRGRWFSGTDLCPVAHGMPVGRLVSELHFLGQTAALERGCDYAARHLGADAGSVRRFVELWDTRTFSRSWLLRQIKDLWQERLADAETMQEILEWSHTPDPETRELGAPGRSEQTSRIHAVGC
jgi:hypothetical protein